MRHRDAILDAVAFAAGEFLRRPSWQESIQETLARLGQAAGVSRVYIFENHQGPQGELLTSQRYEWVAPGITPQINNPELQNFPLRARGFARWEETLGQGQEICGHVRNFPESERPILEGQNIRSIAVMPIFVNDRWWGFIGFDECLQEREWSLAELDALRVAANTLGAAIQRQRTEEELRRRERSLRLLNEITATAMEAKDVPTMLQLLAQQLADLFTADGCQIALWEERQQRFMPVAAYGYLPSAGLPLLEATTSFSESGRRDYQADAPATTLTSDHSGPISKPGSLLSIPLLGNGKRLGLAVIIFNKPYSLSQEDWVLREQVGRHVALAISRIQAMESAQRRAQEAETLRQAGAIVVATLRQSEAIERILEQLARVVPYDSASVQLLRPGYLEIVGGRGGPDSAAMMGVRFPIPGDNPNTIVIQTRSPHILADAQAVYPLFRTAPQSHIHSWLGVPLIMHDQVIGMLALDSKDRDYFTEDHARLVSAFANQVAIAIENARLYAEMEQLALTDALTGLYNRRGLFELGRREVERARRFGRPLGAIMFDLDNFKLINDAYGHGIGDQILAGVSARCRFSLRDADLLARYGGDEFLALLPETALPNAARAATRLLQAVTQQPFETDIGPIGLGVSIGVAALTAETASLDALITQADRALYLAKRSGGNQIQML